MGFANEPAESSDEDNSTRQKLRRKLINGDLDDREIEFEVSTQGGMEIVTPPGMEEMASQLQGMFQNIGGGKQQTRKMTIEEARPILIDDQAAKLINDEEIKQQALSNAEQNGIVFIDEMDKVAKHGEYGGAGVSREGVQRDLLPLVEGCTVSTRYGMVKTDHMLFIASGAFHMSKPSDLVPELQGRLPIRVELRALTVEDFTRILTEPDASLTEQYIALMGTEGLGLSFTKGGVKRAG
jgi:ATP-dependent HslUV protease ATP-binding subunit HslU